MDESIMFYFFPSVDYIKVFFFSPRLTSDSSTLLKNKKRAVLLCFIFTRQKNAEDSSALPDSMGVAAILITLMY